MAKRTLKPSVGIQIVATVLTVCLIYALALVGQQPAEIPNLRFSSTIPVLPTERIDSGSSFQLSLEVLIDGSGPLGEDPIVEISLRRQDKAVPCVTEIVAVSASDLEENGHAAVQVTIDTAGLLGGTYEVHAAILYGGIETSAVDNLLIIGTLSIDDARPELHPIELIIDPAIPLEWGETATLLATIENTGRLSAGAFHVIFEVRQHDAAASSDDWDTEIAALRIPGLARNALVQVSAAFDTADYVSEDALPASLDIRVRVEYPAPTTSVEQLQDQPSELDALNNVLQTSISIVGVGHGRPDLVPLSITFDEDLPLRWDDNMNATVVIANVGGSATAQGVNPTVRFSYRLAGSTAWTLLEDVVISGSLPNEIDKNEVTETVTLNPADIGTYELLVEVDPEDTASSDDGIIGKIAERNETNNMLIVGFSVLGSELQAEGLELPSAAIRQGDAVTVRASVINTADRPADEFVVAFYLSGERFDTFFYRGDGGLAEGERTSVQGILDTRDLPVGEYDLRVVIDPDNLIPEFDEGNNTISMPISILGPLARKAELHLTGARLDPASPVPESSMVVATLTIQNSGEIDSGFFHVAAEYMPCEGTCDGSETEWSHLTDSTGNEIEQLFASLERGETRTVNLVFSTSTLAQGAYRIRFSIDSASLVEEMDESNNLIVTAFSIGEPVDETTDPTQHDAPNLSFKDVVISPSTSVGIGASVTIGATVVNTGIQASGSFMVTLQWTTPVGASYTLLSQRVSNLNPSESWIIPTTTVQTSLPMGPYAIIGLLDKGNEVAESDESDNELHVVINVGQGEGIQPDLVPIAVRFLPSTAIIEAGQDVLVYTTIQNVGALAAGAFSVEVSAGDTVARETWPGLEPLQSIELVHSLGTLDPGSYAVVIHADVNGQIVESDESNNIRSESLQIAMAEQVSVERVLQDQGKVIALALDSSTGTVYAGWQNGTVRATDRNGGNWLVYDAGTAITQMIVSLGVQDVGYLGLADGRIIAVDLTSGSLLVESVPLGGSVMELVRGDSGVLYAATASQLFQLDSTLAGIAQINLHGTLVDLAFDGVRDHVYALTTSGVHAFTAGLSSQCAVTDFVGVPSALAVGSTGVIVGTDIGALRALTFCQSVGSAGTMMLDAWRYPGSGSLGSAVTSITIDDRSLDPIYATTGSGVILALDFSGSLLWSYQRSGSGIHSIPAIDERSGRLFCADDDGFPIVLDSSGAIVLSVDSQISRGSAAGSNLIIDEVRRQTGSGMRLFRVYYFGADDGWIYKIESIR